MDREIDRFARRFHDAIVAIGSMPLPVLEQRMTQIIADESAAQKP